MKSSKFLFLALVVGSLSVGGCKKGEEPAAEAPAAEGSAAPAAEAPAAEASAAEAPAAEAPAAEGSAAPAVAEGSAGAEAKPAELPTSDFVATAEALHGAWNADFQAMLANQQMEEQERALAQAMLGSAQMTLTFNADNSMKMDGMMMGQTQSESGTWTFVSAEANKLNISVTTQKEGAEPETQAMTVAFINATSLVMSDGDGQQTIPFNRAQ